MNEEEELRAEIDAILKRIPPEHGAYLIIRNFFNADNLTEERCEEFKKWFLGGDGLSHEGGNKR
jgi:hypothetical protein